MKTGILFPGYGSQFIGMGKELYDNVRIIQEHFEQASYCLNKNFVKLCFASSDSELKQLHNVYPAIFLISTSIALYIKKEFNIQPKFIAGHGIGEYSAISSFNGISFADGLYLLNKLAVFYNHTKEQLKLDAILVKDICIDKLTEICETLSTNNSPTHISVYKSESDYIVSGCINSIESIKDFIRKKRLAKIKKTDTAAGFHTSDLIDLENQLRLYLTKVDFKDLETPLINGVNLKPISEKEDIKESLMNQISKPLFWHDVVKKFKDCDNIIIPSPGKYLLKEIEDYYPEKNIISIELLKDIDKLKSIV